ncbi:MAG TPA: endonuclease V [Verrucomicrobiae bacterium]|nr:endonuclease V [Verrucomicrobiae bacterium]
MKNQLIEPRRHPWNVSIPEAKHIRESLRELWEGRDRFAIGKHGPLSKKAGTWTDLVDGTTNGERIGAVLRTRDGVRPIYVSQGHRVS